MKNKPCPFCGADLVQENRLNPLAKKICGYSVQNFLCSP